MRYNDFMLNRHEIRERIIFALYQHLLLKHDLNTCFENNFIDEELNDYIRDIRIDLISNKDNYIQEISQYLVKWTFDRLNLVEQAILLESISEIKLQLNDKAIVIDEAVIFTKEYCDDNAYKYINGVLDKICNS